jgi:glycosyltransferase involved in cell wall biosynthesis
MYPNRVDAPVLDPGPPPAAPRLKVCLATWAPFLGGAEVACERLGVGLRQAGQDVLVLVGQPGPVLERLESAGLRCLCLPMPFTDKWRWWRYLRAQRALRRVLRRERPDVLHSNDLPTHQVMSAAARGLGIPRICHHRFPFPAAAIDWFNKFGAERHVFVSRALMGEMCACSSRLRASPRAVLYDGLPLPPEPTAADRLRARRELGLSADRVLVTFAGQIVERKGVADLLHAWARLDPALAGRAELLIIGDDLQGHGEYRVAMERLAAELHSPARFLGFRKDVATWLLASDVAAVPSHVEPLGNATLEAMSYALPVVGGNVGGIPEMIVAEQTGLLVPPRAPAELSAALARLLADESLRQRLGRQGWQRCREVFSLEAHARAALDEYAHVLAPRKAAVR